MKKRSSKLVGMGILFVLHLLFFTSTVGSQAVDYEKRIDAYTIYGKGVYLYPDGSWEYSGIPGVFDVERNNVGRLEEVSIEDLLPAEVTSIYDGDTLTVSIALPPPGILKEERIRLLGIDAPELKTGGGPEFYAVEAKDFTTSMVKGKAVYLAFESKWRDSFGRLLCYLYLEGELPLNIQLLRKGYARVYRPAKSHFHDQFLGLEAEARKEGIGIWQENRGKPIILYIHNNALEEYVEIANNSEKVTDLSGWRLRDAIGNEIIIPAGAVIPAGETLRIYSGKNGIESPPESFYPTRINIWNNSGDSAMLFDNRGRLVSEYEY